MEQIQLGEIATSHGIEREMDETYGFREFCMMCVLRKHRNRNWGDISEYKRIQNDGNAETGGSLVSAYEIPGYFGIGYADRIIVETFEDRKTTVIRFPYED